MAGEVAAGEVAGGVEQDRREEDPVERGVAAKQAVLDRPLEDQRDCCEAEAEGELDPGSDPHRSGVGIAAFEVFGNVAREQLVDRAVQGRDGDEDRRPQHGDLAVGILVEGVGGDEEVDVGDQAGQADTDRQKACRTTELPAAAGRLRLAGGFIHGAQGWLRPWSGRGPRRPQRSVSRLASLQFP